MKTYVVHPLDELGVVVEVCYAIYQLQPQGHTAVAFTYTREMAERICKLLNEDERRREEENARR